MIAAFTSLLQLPLILIVAAIFMWAVNLAYRGQILGRPGFVIFGFILMILGIFGVVLIA